MHSPVSQDTVVRFGVFEADLRSGELRKCGVKVKIQELPFQALKLLVSHSNEVISRDQLREALWPDDVYVDFDRGVISAINRLRDALGDSAENPVFIETVGRRGYRWIAPTLAPATTAVVEPQLADVALSAPKSSQTWKWLLVGTPILVLLSAGGIYRATHRPGKPDALAGPSELNSSLARRPANAEAEDFYLKGRFFWNQRTSDSLTKAVDAFTQAIVHDPTYAPAYVGLADCYNLLREYSVMPASEAYPRALAAAKKAVELDDRSSEAHASLAFASFYGMWDVATGDREFRRAIELDPKNSIAHHWYATYLHSLRRDSEAVSEIERAQALDPDSKSVLADKGWILWRAGRHDEGLALLKQMEAAEPAFVSPHRYLRYVYLENGDYPNTLAELKQEALLRHDKSALTVADAAARGFSSGGGRGMLLGELEAEKKLYDQGLFSPVALADTCSRLGNTREALKYLEAAYAKHDEELAQLEATSSFDNLRNDPGFRQLLAKIGLPPLH
jgi:DNA-binding winged helix-turn-helix (wHTH) protein/Tfp pilus assembly protein PilF